MPGWEAGKVTKWPSAVQQQRGSARWCVIRLRPVAAIERRCSGCGAGTRAVHDLAERRVRDLPLFEHRVELIVPRVRVACAQCGPKLERLEWLAPYARLTRRLAESVARLCRVASILHVARFFDLDWKTVKDVRPRQPGAARWDRSIWTACGSLRWTSLRSRKATATPP